MEVPDTKDVVWMELSIFRLIVQIHVVDWTVEVFLEQRIRIVHNSGNGFHVKVTETNYTIKLAAKAVLRLRGISITRTIPNGYSESPVQPDILILFELSRSGLRLSETDLARGCDQIRDRNKSPAALPPESMAWTLYVAEAVRGTVSLNGRDTVVHDDGGDNMHAVVVGFWFVFALVVG